MAGEIHSPDCPNCNKCGKLTHYAEGNGKNGKWRAFFCNDKSCKGVIWLPHTAPTSEWNANAQQPSPTQILMDEVQALNKRVDEISAYLAQEIREGRLSQPKK